MNFLTPLLSTPGKKLQKYLRGLGLDLIYSGKSGSKHIIRTDICRCACLDVLKVYWNGRENNQGCFLPRQSRRHLRDCSAYQSKAEIRLVASELRELIGAPRDD